MFEWFDHLSPWWYVSGAVFVVSVAWLAYECLNAPVPVKRPQERQPVSSIPVHGERGCREALCDSEQFPLDSKQLTIEIYQLSHQLDELLSLRQYEDAKLIAGKLDAALDRFIIVKQLETETATPSQGSLKY